LIIFIFPPVINLAKRTPSFEYFPLNLAHFIHCTELKSQFRGRFAFGLRIDLRREACVWLAIRGLEALKADYKNKHSGMSRLKQRQPPRFAFIYIAHECAPRLLNCHFCLPVVDYPGRRNNPFLLPPPSKTRYANKTHRAPLFSLPFHHLLGPVFFHRLFHNIQILWVNKTERVQFTLKVCRIRVRRNFLFYGSII